MLRQAKIRSISHPKHAVHVLLEHQTCLGTLSKISKIYPPREVNYDKDLCNLRRLGEFVKLQNLSNRRCVVLL